MSHAERDEPVERGLGVGDRPRPEERGDRQAEDAYSAHWTENTRRTPLVAREPPVDRVVDRGEREEAREDCVHRGQRVQGTLPSEAAQNAHCRYKDKDRTPPYPGAYR